MWFLGAVRVGSGITHLPLGKSEVHLSSALGSQSLVFLERAADNTGGDGQVTVVAVIRIQQSVFCFLSFPTIPSSACRDVDDLT